MEDFWLLGTREIRSRISLDFALVFLSTATLPCRELDGEGGGVSTGEEVGVTKRSEFERVGDMALELELDGAEGTGAPTSGKSCA